MHPASPLLLMHRQLSLFDHEGHGVKREENGASLSSPGEEGRGKAAIKDQRL